MKCRECAYNAPSLHALRNHWSGLHTQQYRNIQKALEELIVSEDVAMSKIATYEGRLPVDIWLKH